jgi:hypothetical protein
VRRKPGRRELRGPAKLLPRVNQVCIRHVDILRERVDLFLARAGIDAIARGARLTGLCLRQHQPRFELGVGQCGERIALARAIRVLECQPENRDCQS